jgi:hypothetical protein
MINFLRRKVEEPIFPPEFEKALTRTDFSEFESFRMAYLSGLAVGLQTMSEMVKREMDK